MKFTNSVCDSRKDFLLPSGIGFFLGFYRSIVCLGSVSCFGCFSTMSVSVLCGHVIVDYLFRTLLTYTLDEQLDRCCRPHEAC